MPTEQEKRLQRCCFTGQRPEKLTEAPEAVQQWLKEQIENAIDDGYVTFITGMTMGVDIWAGEIIVALRDANPQLHLIAAVPWPGFSSKWNIEWSRRYEALLKNADLVKYISRTYDPEVFHSRNVWMVDHSARLIAYYNGASSGARDTIEYAQTRGVELVVGGEQSPVREPIAADTSTPTPNTADELRPYPLNLLDAVMGAVVVSAADIPSDFNKRLMVASTIKEDRMYDFLLARFRDGKTLQAIGDEVGLSRERVRQLLEKYVKRLRNPDILRFLNCGIKDIPEKSSRAMVERLESRYKEK